MQSFLKVFRNVKADTVSSYNKAEREGKANYIIDTLGTWMTNYFLSSTQPWSRLLRNTSKFTQFHATHRNTS